MKKALIVLGVLSVAFAILLISIFNSSSVTYSVSPMSPQTFPGIENPKINYPFPYAGNILPDSPFWGLKALRDKIWYAVTPSPLRRAQLNLLFADKRIVMTEKLFEKGKPEIAMSTFLKGERYLPIAMEQEKIARERGMDTGEFLIKLATAALKHREVADYLIQLAPENAGPIITANEVYANKTYEDAKNALNSKDIPAPKNPFVGD